MMHALSIKYNLIKVQSLLTGEATRQKKCHKVAALLSLLVNHHLTSLHSFPILLMNLNPPLGKQR